MWADLVGADIIHGITAHGIIRIVMDTTAGEAITADGILRGIMTGDGVTAIIAAIMAAITVTTMEVIGAIIIITGPIIVISTDVQHPVVPALQGRVMPVAPAGRQEYVLRIRPEEVLQIILEVR